MEESIIKFSDWLERYSLLKPFIATVLSLLLIYFIKRVSISRVNKKKIDKREKVLFAKKINIYTWYIATIVVVVIWFSLLQGVFVSMVAVAAAIVLATKEIIVCFTGGTLLKTSNYFKVGDRIEINNIRGFVIERGILATKVLEIGPEKHSQQTTGNIISFPNSLVFTNVLKNESYFKGYSIKSYFFKVEDRKKLNEIETFLFNEGVDVCSSYLDEAKKSISKFCEKEGIAIPSIETRTKLIIEDDNELKILLKLPVKNTEIADVEQRLNRKYVDYLIEHKINDLEEA